MKQSLYTLTAAIFLALCTACTEADTVLPIGGDDNGQGNTGTADKGVPLAVNELGLSLEVKTRAGGIVTGAPQNASNNPNPVKKVGIMVTTNSSNATRAYYDPDIPVKEFNYDDASQTWVQDEGTSVFYLGTSEGQAYAFAPVGKEPLLNGIPQNAYPSVGGIEVKAAQTFRFHDTGPVDPTTDVPWDTDQEDYLCKEGGDQVDRWQSAVSLTLKHVLAKVSFRVMEKDGGTLYAGSKVVKVELKSNNGFSVSKPKNGGDPGTVMDIYHGFIPMDTTVPAGSLTFSAAAGTARAVGSGKTNAAEVPVQAFGLVLRVLGKLTAELTLDDGHVFATEPFNVQWDESVHYIYTLLLTPKGVEISAPQVTGWADGTVPNPDVPVN